ncbi:MAG: isocitrate lyase/phosphoenolpyruvate mutase family protein [Pseudomonadota bacterium]|nr:isocitrate lyase/phosphoenolpyruvate mutase family protein [Pseudomonadota bacterium]
MTPGQKLRRALASEKVVFAPLTLDALTGRIAERAGFPAGYISGGALGFVHGVSEALLTLSEIADVTQHVTARTDIAVIVDGGVGFGDAVHMYRTIQVIEASGAAGIEIEDQVAPKRVSHHRGIEHLVEIGEMTDKICAAVDARTDADFVIIARTGAVRNESFEKAIERGNAYADAGADIIMLMPTNELEWQEAPRRFDVPLATITSLDARLPAQWAALGWDLIIDPFTAQTAAVKAISTAYQQFRQSGTTNLDRGEIFEDYRLLPDIAGFQELYDIEDRTTEKTS